MNPEPSMPLPAVHALRKLGRDLALARRKRGISTADIAARLFVNRDTLWRLERGDPSVASGTLATALFVLQPHNRLAHLASPPTDTHQLVTVGGRGVAVITRFDRTGAHRIPFLSAASLPGLSPDHLRKCVRE